MEEKNPLQRIVDVLIDYYGEDRVDLQCSAGGENTVLIYFPHVTVTNENDNSIDITELYVKIKIDCSGKLIGTFTLNRSEYPISQWYSGYLHSHVCGIYKDNCSIFITPCLGNGPIKYTCAHLNTDFDEDIWRLFALELDKYVHTESLSGVPYMYLEKVGIPQQGSVRECNVPINTGLSIRPGLAESNNQLFNELLDKFLPYIIEKKPFTFGFNNGYYIANSPCNIVIRLSNLFIEWYNSLPASEQGTIRRDMFAHNFLIICKIKDEKIYQNRIEINDRYFSYKRYIGMKLWTFKGKQLELNITGIPKDDNPTIELDENSSTLLHPDIVMYIANRMLKVINYKYGNTEDPRLNQGEVYI